MGQPLSSMWSPDGGQEGLPLRVLGVLFSEHLGVGDLGLDFWWMLLGFANSEFRVKNLGLYGAGHLHFIDSLNLFVAFVVASQTGSIRVGGCALGEWVTFFPWVASEIELKFESRYSKPLCTLDSRGIGAWTRQWSNAF